LKEQILETIKELREKEKKRNFSQTFDIVINLKEIDLKKPENKFTEDVVLPHGFGKEAKVAVFSDLIKEVTGADVYNSAYLDLLTRNKRAAKRIAKQTDFFISEPKLMPMIGKILGQYIGPKGKLPKLISGDVNTMVKNYKKSVRIKLKDSPVLQCLVGKESMKDEQIVENIEVLLKFLETKLPKGKHNISKILLKLTMSKPIAIKVEESGKGK